LIREFSYLSFEYRKAARRERYFFARLQMSLYLSYSHYGTKSEISRKINPQPRPPKLQPCVAESIPEIIAVELSDRALQPQKTAIPRSEP
jgi:hypothetical protein